MRTSFLIASWITVIALFLSLARVLAPLTITGRAIEGPAFIISRAGDMKFQNPTIENLLESQPESVYKGPLLKAFLAAYESFNKDPAIPLSKRAIENYEVQFRQNSELYFVVFTIGDKIRGSARQGGESDLTKSVLYVVSKRDYRVKSRKFFK